MSDEIDYKRVGQTWRSTVDSWPPELRREIATLCLYQQTFGFSQADVAGLELIAAVCEQLGVDTVSAEDAEQYTATAASIASRIAALLPPEKP